MQRNQKSKRNNIEDFLCPFTDMCITQGSGGSFSHKGTMANDVRGIEAGVRYPYYAPCTCKCLAVYPESGQSMWQSVDKVRFSNGRIDYATFMLAHDDTQDCFVGQVVNQGQQLGNMGTKGFATGVHCHIEISQSNDTRWTKNRYGIYHFNNEYDTDDCYFVDRTIIIEGMGGNWRETKDVPVAEEQTSNIYVTNYDMYVRVNAGTNYQIKLYKDLTEDGKNNAKYKNENSYAIYKSGTKFTALEIINANNGIWARTPSGYVCIKGASGEEYCSKC